MNECHSSVYEPRRSKIGSSKEIVGECNLMSWLNLQDMLVHSQLNRTVRSGSVSKCNRPRCSHCSGIVGSNSFASTTVSSSFNLKDFLTCASSGVIYRITCKLCHIQYVGQTQQKYNQIMNKHKFDIKHFPGILTTVSEHFSLPGNLIKGFSFIPLGNWKT